MKSLIMVAYKMKRFMSLLRQRTKSRRQFIQLGYMHFVFCFDVGIRKCAYEVIAQNDFIRVDEERPLSTLGKNQIFTETGSILQGLMGPHRKGRYSPPAVALTLPYLVNLYLRGMLLRHI